MEQRSNAAIFPNRVALDKIYIEEKGGILNALTYASAQYIYKVLEKHGRDKIKRFDEVKLKKLKRTIIHKNSHLDEYFAELLFRAILPPHLKDIEVSEHVLMSKEDDTFAKISWPNGVVFGIHSDEAGGAKALAFYDEHQPDGTRLKPSCSQLIAEEFLIDKIPLSIQTVLNEVNYTDSHGSAAHTFNIKNLFSGVHDILFELGTDEINNTTVTKYLTENWKRAIFDTCIVAVIYIIENDLLRIKITEDEKIKFEQKAKRSLDYFLEKTFLRDTTEKEIFDLVAKDLLFKFKVGNHDIFNKSIWFNDKKEEIGRQYLLLPIICYGLEKCWGENISIFVMMHLWQFLFQQQIAFQKIKKELLQAPPNLHINTSFGSVSKMLLKNLRFKPEQAPNDRRPRNFDYEQPLWLYDVSITNPNYPNVKAVLLHIMNNDYASKGNNGFALIYLHDKIINSKVINIGQTIPLKIWQKVSDKILSEEPDTWFQLKNEEGVVAPFLLNRTKAHQNVLPSTLVDADFLKECLISI